ncbi:hypothetical protein [Streptomyces sp. NPDC051636]|uniref:hypothetical protein n=1 Tax=Streptomyces sp. NPDC051636 TaxID=3365663 RepID=UPI0037ADF3EE
MNVALRAAIVRLVHDREVGTDAFAGPVYFMLHGVPSEERARELAAAFHAALYGDLRPLRRAVPGADVDHDGDTAVDASVNASLNWGSVSGQVRWDAPEIGTVLHSEEYPEGLQDDDPPPWGDSHERPPVGSW